MAAEREAKLAPETRSPAWTSGRTKCSAPWGWNLGKGSADEAAGLDGAFWPRALEGGDVMAPAAASGSAAIKVRRRKVFSGRKV